MEKEAKKTPLYSEHLSLGAKMVDFHGWLMPLEYSSIIGEAKTVREKAGLFDLSHMGEIRVKGEEALSFLKYLTANDPSGLEKGEMQYSFFLNKEGGVMDDFMLYRLEDCFLAEVNAVNTEKIFNHLSSHRSFKVETSNITEEVALIGLQGPRSEEILERVTGEDLGKLKFLRNREIDLLGDKLLLSRSGYTGEDGFEIYLSSSTASKLWRRLLEEGKSFGLKAAGLGARDILRCEMGYPLYGQEWDENTAPWEGGFGWVVKLDKDFLGKEALLKRKEKTQLRLIGFLMKEKIPPRQGYLIKVKGEKIGRVTSGTFSPSRGEFIGLGYILKEFSKEGEKIDIEIRGKDFTGEIVNLPFVKGGIKR